jgi:2-(1,2-epoxy-1,2-dihydrophenyl)acetyl-CoA isomerase
MVEPSVLSDREGAVAVVTLNRPGQRNALDLEMKTALLDALTEAALDPEVRAVVLTGAGSAFCVGQDLGEHAEALSADPRAAFETVERHYSPIVLALATMPKPVIAAVNGTCVGAGLGFALACDLRVYADGTTLGTAFSSIGLTCDSGLSSTLARSVGDLRARDLVLTARTFRPADAVAWGMAGEIVAAEDVLTVAIGQASKLAKGPTAAFAESKMLLAGATYRSLAAALTDEAAAQTRCGLTDDHSAAVSAFLGKRVPDFAGH